MGRCAGGVYSVLEGADSPLSERLFGQAIPDRIRENKGKSPSEQAPDGPVHILKGSLKGGNDKQYTRQGRNGLRGGVCFLLSLSMML